MPDPTFVLTHLERQILELVSNGPKSFTALRSEVDLFIEDLRASTVRCLVEGLVNAGLIVRTREGLLGIPQAV